MQQLRLPVLVLIPHLGHIGLVSATPTNIDASVNAMYAAWLKARMNKSHHCLFICAHNQPCTYLHMPGCPPPSCAQHWGHQQYHTCQTKHPLERNSCACQSLELCHILGTQDRRSSSLSPWVPACLSPLLSPSMPACLLAWICEISE